MKKLLGIFWQLSCCWGRTAAIPASHIKSNKSYFGCISKDDFIAMVHYMMMNNESALNKAMTAGLSAGTIVAFTNNEQVYVMDQDYSTGLIQVFRPEKDTQLYWTVHEAVLGK